MQVSVAKSASYGIIASLLLLGIYFGLLTLISGWQFAEDQFSVFWYFILSLAIGFGIQIALYHHLKNLVRSGQGMGKVVGVTGASSTVAMVSCCAHYLVNLLPILGITGLVTFVAQYQTDLFWLGIIFNLFGIVFILNRIIKFKKKT